MAYVVKPMLYLADLYFTDGNENFRFQWTTKAFVAESANMPNDSEEEEYYQDLAKYNYRQEHLNDGSNKAVKFKVTIYDKKNKTEIASKIVNGFEAEFKLNDGEYLWDVVALDANGNEITRSEKAYFINPDFEDYDDLDADISYKDSSANHKIVDIDSIYGDVNTGINGCWICRKSVIGKINTGNKEAYFSVCGPGDCGDEEAWNMAQNGGYMYSVSNAFGGFNGEFLASKDCLITCGGIYEYENGKWNYKLFTEPWMCGSEAKAEKNYMFYDRTIYTWDTEQDKLVEVRTVENEIYFISDLYYLTEEGVFSIEKNEHILEYNVEYGENLIFNDMFFNVFVRDQYGNERDCLEIGEKGSVVVKYYFIDKETHDISSKEVVIWETAKSNIFVDSDEIFNSRIGNCICFNIQDESDYIDGWISANIVIHELSANGDIKTYKKTVTTAGDVEFSTNTKGQIKITCDTFDSSKDYVMAINPDFNMVIADDKNNWSDLKENGSSSEDGFKELGAITAPGVLVENETVCKGDEFDYYQFTLDSAAKLKFDIDSSDATKFVIYELVEKTVRGTTTYSLKALQTTTLAKAKGATNYTATSKDLLLGAGTYYIGVQSTNAAKGGNAEYNFKVSDDSFFYTEGNNYDDWTDLKENGAMGEVGNIGTIDPQNLTVESDWVGYGDVWDYKSFTLDSAAKLKFDIDSSDATKFVIYELVEKTVRDTTTYSLKALQTTTLAKAKGATNYTATSKDLLLGAGTYYIGVQSTNAAKGGNAEYNFKVSDDSFFYTRGDDGNNNWLYDKQDKVFNYLDNYTITNDESFLISGETAWVGFDDEYDYFKVSVESDMNVAFYVSATDAVKFSVYQVVNGRLITLKNITVKADNAITLSNLLLKSDGEYYIGIQSSNAAKGGNAEYTIEGTRFVKPLNMTLKGVAERTFDAWDDTYEDNCMWDDDYGDYIKEKMQKANALNFAVEGTEGHDIIRVKSGNISWVAGSISLGGGNDQIILAPSSGETKLEVRGDWNEWKDGIDLGVGNDTIIVDKNCDMELSNINFGDGDDKFILRDNADGIECYEVNFGDGDDKFIIGKISEEMWVSELDMGDGDDLIEIDSLTGYSVINKIDMGYGDDTLKVNDVQFYEEIVIDFGDGYDTLIMNGTLFTNTIINLEEVKGQGTFVFMEIPDDYTLEIFKEAGIDLVQAGLGFTTREKEVANNNRETATDLTLYNDVAFFWLESEAVASNKGEFGCADPVDWIKLDTRKLSREDEIEIQFGDSITCTLYDPKGKEIEICDTFYVLEDWTRGIYYLKFEVAEGSCGSFSISIDD